MTKKEILKTLKEKLNKKIEDRRRYKSYKYATNKIKINPKDFEFYNFPALLYGEVKETEEEKVKVLYDLTNKKKYTRKWKLIETVEVEDNEDAIVGLGGRSFEYKVWKWVLVKDEVEDMTNEEVEKLKPLSLWIKYPVDKEVLPNTNLIKRFIRIYYMSDFDLNDFKLIDEPVEFQIDIDTGDFQFEYKLVRDGISENLNECENIEWLDIPEETREKIEFLEEVAKKVCEKLNKGEIPNIKQEIEKVKEEREKEKLIEIGRKIADEEVVEEYIKERDEKVKEIILNQKLLKGLRIKGKDVDEGSEITDDIANDVLKFILANPFLFLSDDIARGVEQIKKETEEEINNYYINLAKKNIPQGMSPEEYIEYLENKELEEKRNRLVSYLYSKVDINEMKKYGLLEKVKEIEKYIKDFVKIYDEKMIDKELRCVSEELETLKEKEEYKKKILNSEIPVFSYITPNNETIDIYLKDFNAKGNIAYIKLPENLIGHFIGKGGSYIKTISKLLNKRVQVLKDKSVNFIKVKKINIEKI